jgi:hypothetical protein
MLPAIEVRPASERQDLAQIVLATEYASRTAGSFYMSGMSSMLRIALYRDAPSPNEPN